MKVSIIIPTVGSARVNAMLQCLKSINNQTKLPIEVLIICTKNDPNYAQKLSKIVNISKFPIRIFEVLGGTCKSRNFGIDQSIGELLLFLDDDVILEENYLSNISNIFIGNISDFVVTGYIFDVQDLATSRTQNLDDISYLIEFKDSKFISSLFLIVKERYGTDLENINSESSRKKWNFLKTIFLMESYKKGIILPSGFRSEMPSIKNLSGLCEVQWFPGGNFAIKREIALKYKFDEKMEELYNYAVSEDIELSLRISKNYKIYICPECKMIHLRDYSPYRIQGHERLYSMIVNHYYIASKMGYVNKLLYFWSIVGILLSRSAVFVDSPKQGLKEIQSILNGLRWVFFHIPTKGYIKK
jgi:glucosyl-dolichyl phosphate glucuronosyltransferase